MPFHAGTVIGSRGRTECEVEFDDFDRQVVFVNNLIPTQGSTARPKVAVSFYPLFLIHQILELSNDCVVLNL